jgi:hypothetical protein
MPKEAINLDILLSRIFKNEIISDTPLIVYKDNIGNDFPVFQSSGLNLLLGFEGNGKTKFITECICRFLDSLDDANSKFFKIKILFVYKIFL